MIRIVSTFPFAPPLPPVNALPVVLPPGFTTGDGPVAPFGTGNAVPPGETTKSGALFGTLPAPFVAASRYGRRPIYSFGKLRSPFKKVKASFSSCCAEPSSK